MHKIHVVSGYLVTRLHMEITQHVSGYVSGFIYGLKGWSTGRVHRQSGS